MGWRVVVTSRSFGRHSPQACRVLEDAGCAIVWFGPSSGEAARVPGPAGGPSGSSRPACGNDARVREDAWAGADAAIVGAEPITAGRLESARRLKIVCKHGTGVDNIDLDAARALGVAVANVPGVNADAVADLAVGCMIALARGIARGDRCVREGRWEVLVGTQVWRKTLGLVGFGRVGQAVARRARGFDMRILAFDPFFDPEAGHSLGVSRVSLDALLRDSDFVSIHAPLTDVTRAMIGYRELCMMKPTAYIVNTARGGIVCEEDLALALRERRLAGAALDVFENERPDPSNPLLAMDNTLVLPHLASYTTEALGAVSIIAAQNVIDYLRTGTCGNLVVAARPEVTGEASAREVDGPG